MNLRGWALALGLAVTAGVLAATPAKREYNPVDYGAVPDGTTLCTAAIQQAIDAAAAAGGGVVRIPAGRFLTGTIFLKSHVTLDLAKDSVLLGSPDLSQYPTNIPAFRSYTDTYTFHSLVYGENLTNVVITGQGTIDGQGTNLKGEYKKRPYGMRFIACTNLCVEGITLRNAAMWMQHYLACDDLTLRKLTVWNHGNANNDGIDIDGCRRVLVEDCTIDSGDDGICLKSTSGRVCEAVVVRRCTISTHCSAFKLGTESHGGFRSITFTNSVIKPSAQRQMLYGNHAGMGGIELDLVDGGTLEDVRVNDITIEGTMAPVFIRLGNRARIYAKGVPKPGVGYLRNVTIANVKATGAGILGCVVAGLTDHPVENLVLRNLDLTFVGGGREEDAVRRFGEKPADYPGCKLFGPRMPAYGFFFWHVKGLELENVRLAPAKPNARPMCVLEDVADLRIDGKTVRDAKDLPEGFRQAP